MGKAQRILALAAVLGVAAAVVGYYALTALATRTNAPQADYANVVVTAADITFGTKLEPTMLKMARYPRESVPVGAFTDLDSVVGQTTKVFMGAREPVTALKLSSRGGGLSMLVRPNMRAASIEVDRVSGVSGFVLPGDRVDVLTTVEQRGAIGDAITSTLLQNIEVLAAGQKTNQDDNKPLTVQSVTLLVDPEGAEKLAHAQYEGKIHLVLRNPEDQTEVETASFSTREMLGQRPRRVVRHISRGRPDPPQPPKPTGPEKIRMIRSASITEVPAIQDSTESP